MKEYLAYKQWWIDYQSEHYVGSLYYGDNAEEAFEQHVKDLGLYGLMEAMAMHSEIYDEEDVYSGFGRSA